jgi:signal transduction histidine kinase
MVFLRRRLVGILLTLTVVSFVVLTGLGWRSLSRFEVALARVLRQASAYTARETAERIQRDFKAPAFNLLEQVDHRAIRLFELEKIADTLRDDANYFQIVDTFFVWSAASKSDAEVNPVAFYSPSSSLSDATGGAPLPGRPRDDGFFSAPKLSPTIKSEARRLAMRRSNFALGELAFDGGAYQVVYHFLYDQNDRSVLLAFEGFLAGREHLYRNYFGAFRARLQHQDDAEFPALAVSIVDDTGREVYRSGRSLLTRYESEARFPFVFFDTDLIESLGALRPEIRYWSVRTGYEGGAVEALVHEQSTQQRWAWVMVGLVAVVGVALTAAGAARAVALAEMKSEFVASVSHELKTPLAKIQLYAETLESGRARTPEKAAAYQRVISAQARKLSQLIGALLDFSKIEDGVRRYALEEIDLRAVLLASVEMFDHELSQDGFVVETVLPDAEVSVLGNGEGLQQLFGNLISNALKYSPDQHYLRVALSTVGGRALVEVTDRGIGIPRREQRRIFKKFRRGSGALAIAATGSGIGLTIVDHVLRAHGGTISVSSAPGQGSTFTVELPLMVASTEEQGAAHFGH